MTTYKESMKKRTGTSFKGYVVATYQDLVATFGLPTTQGDDYKIDAEWIIDTPHGVATVYNYKDGKAYLGGSGIPTEKICEWHIGGKNNQVYAWVKTKMGEHQLRSFS